MNVINVNKWKVTGYCSNIQFADGCENNFETIIVMDARFSHAHVKDAIQKQLQETYQYVDVDVSCLYRDTIPSITTFDISAGEKFYLVEDGKVLLGTVRKVNKYFFDGLQKYPCIDVTCELYNSETDEKTIKSLTVSIKNINLTIFFGINAAEAAVNAAEAIFKA